MFEFFDHIGSVKYDVSGFNVVFTGWIKHGKDNDDYFEKTLNTLDIATKILQNAKYYTICRHIHKKGLDILIYLAKS